MRKEWLLFVLNRWSLWCCTCMIEMQLLFHVRATSRTRLLVSARIWPRNARGCYRGNPKWNSRPLSCTACLSQVHSSSSYQIGDGVQAVTDAFESSAQARWAADAASISELPVQGDFSSLGLGGHSPVGLLQSMLEWVHLHTGLPWWGSIAACTVLLRFVLFPLVVHLQKNAIRMNNIKPEMDKIQERLRTYQQSGESSLASMETANLLSLYQQHGCNPLKMALGPLVQVGLCLLCWLLANYGWSATNQEMSNRHTL